MQQRPRARREGVIAEELGDGTVIHEAVTGRAHRLDATATAVFKLADGTRTVAEIATEIGLGEREVQAAVHQLDARGLLLASAGVSRRWILRRGAAIGAGAPIVPLRS